MLASLKKWIKKVTAHCDPAELEQAKIRIVVGLVIFAFSFYLYINHKLAADEFVVFKINLIFQVLATGLLFSIIKNQFNPATRRILGAWIDIGTATVFMSLTNDIGVALVTVYLWVIFGNGFRYGKKYLYHSQLLSIIGFIITLNVSPYWRSHEAVGYSLLAMLVLLPLYVAQLITRLNEAKQNAEEASARAADASLAKTRFVANMSHEIRTPLNGIIGISTLFKTTPLNADQRDLLKTLEGSSKLLLSLLNNVLDFTKIEARKFTVENVAFSVEEAVHDTMGIFRAQSVAKGIQLGASISNTLGTLKGDAFVLRQVLANLMGNAIKFTDKGSVTISAIALQEDAERLTVRFEVADTGVGIATDKQDKIFESFTQADSSTTRQFGGSGLGLTIAKHMVEAMGGNLQLQSTAGSGSRFWFDLSLEKDTPAAAPIDSPATTPIATISKIQANTKPLDILVCEDESTNQKIITRLLSLPGHNVSIVSDGDAMLDALEVRKFDLVITDLNMVGMSGADALKLYRFTQPNDKDTRFILFTADATLTARQVAGEAGFDAFLTKPIDAATLFNTMESILNLAPNTAATWMNNALNNPIEVESDLAANNTALNLDTLKELERIGAGDELFMHRLLRNYLADSVKIIYKIETAVKQKRYGELHDFCHALKGNSLSVGALQLAEITENIGKLSASVPFNTALEMLDNLNRNFGHLTIAIEDYLRRPAAKTPELASSKF
jgi:two-component system, sensor histidine kinase RpfC